MQRFKGKADLFVSYDEKPSKETISSLITKAVHTLDPFSKLETIIHQTSENFDAKSIFIEGMDFGRCYDLMGSYLIFAQHFEHDKTQETLQALHNKTQSQNSFELLSSFSDVGLVFCAGFLLEASRRFHCVLSGDLRMATVLLIADVLREDVLMRVKHDNITLTLTKQTQELDAILSSLSYKPNTFLSHFDFSNSEIDRLQAYTLDSKDGANAALDYARANSLSDVEILNEIEIQIYMQEG